MRMVLSHIKFIPTQKISIEPMSDKYAIASVVIIPNINLDNNTIEP